MLTTTGIVLATAAAIITTTAATTGHTTVPNTKQKNGKNKKRKVTSCNKRKSPNDTSDTSTKKQKKYVSKTRKKKGKERREEMLIITQNVRGGAERKLEKIENMLERTNPDIMIITETKMLRDRFEAKGELQNQIAHYKIYANGYSEKDVKEKHIEEQKAKIIKSTEYKTEIERTKALMEINTNQATAQGGVWMLLHERMNKYLDGEPLVGTDKRSIIAKFKFPKRKINIIGIYAPTEDKTELKTCIEYWGKTIEADANAEVILMGDMNAYTDPDRDTWSKNTPQTKRTGNIPLSNLITEQNLTDAYISKYTQDEAVTGHTYFQKTKETGEITYSARIDIALVSNTLQEEITECKPMAHNAITYNPDHVPLQLRIRAEALGLIKSAPPQLPKIQLSRIDVRNMTEEKKELFKKNTNARIKENELLLYAKDQIESDESERKTLGMEIASETITQIIKEEGYRVFGERKIKLNQQRTKNTTVSIDSLRKNLKRVNRVITAMHTKKNEIVNTKAWEKIKKNKREYKPEAARRETLITQADVPQVKKELGRIQKKITKKLKTEETEEIQKRIAEYIEELDTKEEDTPKNFYKQANIDKVNTHKQLTEVTYREDNIEKVEQDPKKVMLHTFTYWKTMFAERKPIFEPHEEWLHTAKQKEIREKIAAASPQLTKNITVNEIVNTLKTFKKKKSPGSNEIPFECLQAAPEEIHKWLSIIFNTVIQTNKSPKEWKESTLFTLHKGGDHTRPANYRPITLLNAQYKLFMKILTFRTTSLLEKNNALTNVQGGWRKRRATHQKTNILLAAIEDSINGEHPLHVAYIDLSKAYDTVDHKYLYKILEHTGFHAKFIDIVKEQNTDNTCRVITPYGLTDTYPIERGVRQGCPMSPLLFTLYIEPCLRWIDLEKGYTMNRTTEKEEIECTINILAFADDITLVGSSHENIARKWDMLKRFCTAAGLTISNDGISKEKTVYTHNEPESKQIPPLYSDRENQKKIPTLKANESYKYLGVFINLKLNWQVQEDICTKKLIRQTNYLRHKAFTAKQTITIINKVLIPPILYRANIINFSEKTTKRWDAITSALVFLKMGMEKISGRNYLFEGVENNGMGLISTKHMAKATHITSELENKLLASDTDTYTLAEMHFDTTKEKIRELTRNKIKIIKNKSNTKADELKIENWCDKAAIKIFKKHKIYTIAEIHHEGKIDNVMRDKLTRRKHIPTNLVEKLIRDTTAHDKETLIPDILFALNKADTKPDITENEWTYGDEYEIVLYVDGSFDEENQQGTYAVVIGPEHRNACVIVPRAYSSLEVELRAIIHALAITPWKIDVTIFTDSANSIDAIKAKYTGTQTKKRKKRDEKLIERTVELIKKKEENGAKIKVCFVYSHLRDEQKSEQNEKKSKEQEETRKKKETIMAKMYGEKAEAIILGNKAADNLTKNINKAPHVSTYAEIDPEYIIRVDGRDSTWKTRATCYEHFASIENRQNRHSHPNAYEWMESDKIERKLSQTLLIDNSRKLTKTRNFMFKLRNDKLKTMEKMNSRYTTNKKDSHYAKHVLAKYTTDKCPLCETEKETTQHLTECNKTTNLRENAVKKIYTLIQNHVKEIRDETMEMDTIPSRKKNIERKIRKWLFTEDKGGWKRKWGWFGYISKNLINLMGKITWKDEQNTFTIIKKIQIIIIETMNESWLRRCKKLHAQEMSGEAIKKLREQAEGKWKNIRANAHKLPALENKTTVNLSRNFESRTQPTLPTPKPPQTKPKRKSQANTYHLSSIHTDERDSEDGRRLAAQRAAADDTEDEGLLQPLWEKRYKPSERQTPPRLPPERTKKCATDQGEKKGLEGSGSEARGPVEGATELNGTLPPNSQNPPGTVHTPGDKRRRSSQSESETEDPTAEGCTLAQKQPRHAGPQETTANTALAKPTSREGKRKEPPDRR